jgi:diacylglycerol kinase (ATP)
VGAPFRFAYDLTRSKVDTIIACGGDGTMNEVLKGIMTFPSDYKPKISVFSHENNNDFLMSFGRRSLTEIPESIQASTLNKIDGGLIQYHGRQRYFLNSSSAGFGADVHRDVQLSRRGFLPAKWVYTVSSLKWLLQHKPATVKIESPGQSF